MARKHFGDKTSERGEACTVNEFAEPGGPDRSCQENIGPLIGEMDAFLAIHRGLEEMNSGKTICASVVQRRLRNL